MKTRTRVWALAVMLAVTLGGCAPPAATAGSRSSARATLTAEQLAATNSENLFDAIGKLRPEWLTNRGPSSVTDPSAVIASVFMGGSYLGKTDVLKDMRVLDVTEVRYYDAASASARFGMGHPKGVIELTRK